MREHLGTIAFSVFALAVIVWMVIEQYRKAKRGDPPSRIARPNPLPPACTAIEEIRREVDESQKRSEAARRREDEGRAYRQEQRRLEAEWIRDGELMLRPKRRDR